MTTYVYQGFSTDSFAPVRFAIQSQAEDPTLDYRVNWREPDGLFNVDFDVEAFDIVVDGMSVFAPDPYLDVYFVRYDWGTGQTTFALTLYDQVTQKGYALLLGGDLFDVSDAATVWPQVTAGTATNPLPGTGFAIGESRPLDSLPGATVTEADSILGTEGDDSIFSGIGNDTLLGQAGRDTLEGEGDDDRLDGGRGADLLSGGDGNDTLLGGQGDDTLDGGAGEDAMRGGRGSDTYLLDSAGDRPFESRNFAGTDRIVAGFDYRLSGHYEELELSGTGDFRGIGNSLDNLLIGNAGNNILDGRAGDDTLAGRGGNDTYYLRDPGDVVVERAGLGNDTVNTWFGMQAPAHVETLILRATGDADLLGNSLSNLLYGNMQANLLKGGAGNDTLIGQAGDDTLVGGAGADTLEGGDGSDTYILTSRFSWRQEDVVRESAGHSGIDHVIASDSDIDMFFEHVENISMRGTLDFVDIRANNLDNVIRGSEGLNYIYGHGGNDRIDGRGDRDYLYGGAGNDTLLGGTGDDFLDGQAGDDILSGGAGNDTYFVDGIGDRVIEAANGGIDTLHAAIDTNLAAALENLRLEGTAKVGNGNAKANRIYGNNEANLLQGLDGNDTLNGGNGNDTLRGGAGNDLYEGSAGDDTYFLMDAGDDLRWEYRWYSGTDTVVTTQSQVYEFSTDIENTRLLGSDDLNVTRYDLGRQGGELRGNAGNNVLDGSRNANDTMLGGPGDDSYVVENARDMVIEGANAGDDIVRSRIDYALTAHVERLTLVDRGSINGFGNGLDNTIMGNAVNNRIAGREGSDTLTGGAGEDTFIFDRALGPDNVDTITDFSSAADTMILRASVFAGLATGTLDGDALRGGSAVALDADDRILYDRATGELRFDADGAGGADAILFAVLENKTAIGADDFVIV